MNIQNLIKKVEDLFKNKKFDEAITKLNQALDQIKDKDSQIQEQNDMQFWLGRCYLEQAMKAKGEASTRLFEQAIEHHQQQSRLAKQLEDENGIQKQIYAQSWLGRCYFEQAMKAKGEASKRLFEQAIEHHQQQLRLAKQLEGENGIQGQINAQSWLGHCYLEQAIKTKGEASTRLFEQAIEHRQQQLRLAKQLEGENGIQGQINAQSWLGRCYLEQAIKTKGEASTRLFEQAIEHRQQQLRLAEQLEGENGIQEQIDAQHWLGRCYFEQAMKAEEEASEQLFRLAIKHHQQQLRLAKQLEDKQNSIQKQINAQSWLGGCYLEQAKKAKGKDSEQLLERAIEYFQQQLSLAKKLEDKQNNIQEQNDVQFFLGRCYLEQAKKAKGKDAEQLFGKAIKHFRQSLKFAKQLTDEQDSLQKQINTQYWLGCCYLEQAMKSKEKDSERLFKRAIGYFQQQLSLATKLEDKQNNIRAQIYAQFGLGRCYLKQVVKIKDKDSSKVKELTKKANEYFLFSFNNLPRLNDKLERNRVDRIILQCLREISFLQKRWQIYFEQKKQEIRGKLFKNKKDGLTDAITTILAVLNIPPIELGSIPLAHYTSPSVCERLFGIVCDKTNDKFYDKDPIDSNKVSPIRMGSSTYMNDLTEGEGVLELLNLQDLELENKVDCPDHNAFFACFSSRINDLNQFRLYGKENGVEASGCCLVFNNDGNWLKEPNVSVSFRSMAKKGDEYSREQLVEADISDSDLEDANLPLYQVTYIAYKDEYLAEDKCRIWLPSKDDQKFGIQLEPVGKNSSWYDFRISELEKALKQLIKFFKEKTNINNENRKALEYIRYLFKDFAFRDEEEFRLLKIEQIGSDKIEYCENTQSIYLPYADARDIVDEVILGTNYEKSGKGRKAEAFQHLMRKHYPNVKVSRSSLPINANPPIKKD